MNPLARILHVVAVGLWFGASVFFTFVVGLSLFGTFERLTGLPAEDRPAWLPVPPAMSGQRPSAAFPEPLRKEQGSRLAGAAVGPMFFWYYAIQVACGAVALATALAWRRLGGVHRLRALTLGLALAGALAGWWLERRVEGLRVARSEASDWVLAGQGPSSSADEARAEFGRWHTYSLGANLLTVGLVTIAIVLAAFLPADVSAGSGMPPPGLAVPSPTR